MMHVGTCVVELALDGVFSLKEKRRIVKSITRRLSNQFNIAIAEIDCQDVWRTAVIGFATVGNDVGRLHSILEKAIAWIEKNRPDLYIVGYEIEFR